MIKRSSKNTLVEINSFLVALLSSLLFAADVYYQDTHGVTDAGFALIITPIIFLIWFLASLILGWVVLKIEARKNSHNRTLILIAVYAPLVYMVLITLRSS